MNSIPVGEHRLRLAGQDDIPAIMELLDAHWEKGCLLSRDRAFFEYDYLVDGRLNVLVAENAGTLSIDAMLGIIQSCRRRRPDGFTSMWVSRPKPGTSFLGMHLLDNVRKLHPVRHIASTSLRVGASVRILQTFYHSSPRRLNHFYRLADRDEYRIARIVDKRIAVAAPGRARLMPLPTMARVREAFDFASRPDEGIYKDDWYVERRYFQHPYYRFNVWGIEVSRHCEALLIGKTVSANGGRALRIVDFLGNETALRGIAAELDRLMLENDLEYTDFYCLGISPDCLGSETGFVLRDAADTNVIPNHFEPFVQENIDIWVCSHLLERNRPVRLFKGDGDQGRPKRLRLPEEWILQT